MSLKQKLNGVDCQLDIGIDLSHLSTMRLKAKGDLITVKNVEALCHVVKALDSYQLIGWGANSLLSEESKVPYLQLKIDNNKEALINFKDEYSLSASTSIAKLVSTAAKLGLSGWECLTGIPGSLGGSVFGNAGTKFGEISSIVKRVYIVTKDGLKKEISGTDLQFSYRRNNFLKLGDVIYHVDLCHFGKDLEVAKKIKEYLAYRNKTQPLTSQTCGCIFKNSVKNDETCPAGKYIDIIGLKGFRFKNVQISSLHGNFMMNLGGATKAELLELIDFVKYELYQYTGIHFETEVVI